jgi:hypothetical protein
MILSLESRKKKKKKKKPVVGALGQFIQNL